MTGTVWLTVSDAAIYAVVSKDTIYTACERSELQHVKVGGRKAIRLRAQWIDAWLEQHVSGGSAVEQKAPAELR